MTDILGETLIEVRTVHSRARTAWKTLDETRKRTRVTPEQYLDDTHKMWDDMIARNPRLTNRRPTNEKIMERYRYWSDEDEAAWEKLDQVVRLLDEYARPNKQVYGGAGV